MNRRERAHQQLRRPRAWGQATWRDIGHADAVQQNRPHEPSPIRHSAARVSANLRCAIAHRGISIRLLRDSGLAAGAAPRNDVMGAVNAFLTINWAKIAE